MKAKAKHDEPEGATVTFIGDPRGRTGSNAKPNDPASINIGGVEFPLNKPVPVDDKWLADNERVKKNTHFEVHEPQAS